ncbi:MAG: hypothetical protein AABX38_04485 [Candidatus Micrarchaeota archaeon]
MQCYRCGASEGQIEYGTDGLPYCTSCIFYASNSQCNRCRMYLPVTEMQQYRGQLCCQYCIADLRSENRSREQPTEKLSNKDPSSHESDLEPEYCDICKKKLSTVFILNGLKMCENCAEKEKKKWKGTGSEKPPMWMIRVKESKKDKQSILISFIKFLNEFIRGNKNSSKQSELENVNNFKDDNLFSSQNSEKESLEKQTSTNQKNKTKEISFKEHTPLEEKDLQKSKSKK